MKYYVFELKTPNGYDFGIVKKLSTSRELAEFDLKLEWKGFKLVFLNEEENEQQ